ncbi:DUF4352 domain-containing protein [Saccharomonospora iraqiensis]|uniref:DUF4352 domain-containing protein n=1 Tax=Saccharomonospora iraqiensis TaxID=52698 RepID=UPI001376BE26|nr:DUF4352 domain-containing protein [Saccharomonospora iraqiensis]
MSEAQQSSGKGAEGSWFGRHKVLTALLVVFVVIGIGSALGGGGDGSDGSGGSDAPAEAAAGGDSAGDEAADGGDEPETAGLNTPARDGKFEFTVSGVDCGRTEVGNEFAGTTAQGQFCLVSMTVENIGDEPQSLFGDNQKLYDAEGREFSADTEAGIYLDQDSQTLFEEINPGNAVEGVVVFDIPADATPAELELHDSAFSGGVVVEL